jgi:hypothetical protein
MVHKPKPRLRRRRLNQDKAKDNKAKDNKAKDNKAKDRKVNKAKDNKANKGVSASYFAKCVARPARRPRSAMAFATSS